MRYVVLAAAATMALVGCGGNSSPQTTSSGRAGGPAIPTCRRADYRLLKPQLNGATGAIVSGAGVRSRSDTPCRLHAAFRLAVRRRDGSLVDEIRGNPRHALVDTRLGPHATAGIGGAWRNWCGRYGISRPPRVDHRPYRFRFVASTGGQAAAAGASPPRCDSPNAPSTLSRIP
jgi:hypothetical protein